MEQYGEMNKLLIKVSDKFEKTNKVLLNIQNDVGNKELKFGEMKNDIDRVSELVKQLKLQDTQR